MFACYGGHMDRLPNCYEVTGADYLDARDRAEKAKRFAASVDGMKGPEGMWPPQLNPLLVREVAVTDADHHEVRLTFREFP